MDGVKPLRGHGLVTQIWILKKGKQEDSDSFPLVPQKRSWRSELVSQGTPVTVMQEPCALAGTWYREYAETQGWTEAMCRAQHCWVRPESPTDIPSAFRFVCTLQNQLDMFLSQQNTVYFVWSFPHYNVRSSDLTGAAASANKNVCIYFKILKKGHTIFKKKTSF